MKEPSESRELYMDVFCKIDLEVSKVRTWQVKRFTYHVNS